MKYISHSADDTEKIAYNFASMLRGGEIINLDGDLGAGKTAFIRGLAKGLGISDIVSSPTFTIVNEYRKGNIPLFHFDVYRIGSSEEMYDIGWDDYISQGAVVAVEWSVNISDIFNGDEIKVMITKDLTKSEEYREITIEGAV
ncbi:MAG: tRNA (adenosine(37)-N6)-threonylcarbamoyltransferase complex ATPase subunit type 1 TsaE [Clostridia bacterium]|nr:tRNA (adenosine(37)-N6)-threonylcarbamoyltransferase complex ATPase subunit type 1 TsaE [Clostridia bacterium]